MYGNSHSLKKIVKEIVNVTESTDSKKKFNTPIKNLTLAEFVDTAKLVYPR